MTQEHESDLRRLVHQVKSCNDITDVGLAAILSTDTDTVRKSQIGQYIRGEKGFGRERRNRLYAWLKQMGYEIIVPEYKEKEET